MIYKHYENTWAHIQRLMGSSSLAISKLQAEQRTVSLHDGLCDHLKQQYFPVRQRAVSVLKKKAMFLSLPPITCRDINKNKCNTDESKNTTAPGDSSTLQLGYLLKRKPAAIASWTNGKTLNEAQLIKLNQWLGSYQENGFGINRLWAIVSN